MAGCCNTDEPGDTARVQLWSTIDVLTLRLDRGVMSHPRIGDEVYHAPEDCLKILTHNTSGTTKEDEVLIDLARLSDAHAVKARVSPESLFGRHCAIVGTSGSGKSWTLARIVEQLANYHSKTILFDSTGE